MTEGTDSNGNSSSNDINENDWAGSSSDEDGGDRQHMLNFLFNLKKQILYTFSSSDNNNNKTKTPGGGGGGKILFKRIASEAAAHVPEGKF